MTTAASSHTATVPAATAEPLGGRARPKWSGEADDWEQYRTDMDFWVATQKVDAEAIRRKKERPQWDGHTESWEEFQAAMTEALRKEKGEEKRAADSGDPVPEAMDDTKSLP